MGRAGCPPCAVSLKAVWESVLGRREERAQGLKEQAAGSTVVDYMEKEGMGKTV